MMKQKKCRGLLIAMLGCLMLTGCGEAPYELTEEEQKLIVTYSAHVVSKFNTYQKDGLTYVPDIEDVAEDVVEDTTDTEVIPETEDSNVEIPEIGAGEVAGTENEVPAIEMTMDSVFADLGLSFTYLGNEVTASYMQDNTYAVNAGIDKKLLVLKFNVANLTEQAIIVDNLIAGDEYSAKYVMDSGKAYNAKTVMTLLMNDFSTYEGTFAPQEVKEMVVIFEIPKETTIVDTVELMIRRNGSTFVTVY